MSLILFKPDEDPDYANDCYNFIVFKSKLFQFRWFTDCGDWFLYIHLGKRFWRFSSAGFIHDKME